jgi:hypothetical protein
MPSTAFSVERPSRYRMRRRRGAETSKDLERFSTARMGFSTCI